jgi:ribosomal protein L12E/L44/L45/RPP1/RPP2
MTMEGKSLVSLDGKYCDRLQKRALKHVLGWNTKPEEHNMKKKKKKEEEEEEEEEEEACEVGRESTLK